MNVSTVRPNTDMTSSPVQPGGASYCHGPGSGGGADHATRGVTSGGGATGAAGVTGSAGPGGSSGGPASGAVVGSGGSPASSGRRSSTIPWNLPRSPLGGSEYALRNRPISVVRSEQPEPAPRTGSVHDAEWRLDARTRDAPVGWRCAHGDRDLRERHQEIRRRARGRQPEPRHRRRRVHGPRRTVRLRQDDQPPDDRRSRGDQRRHPPDRRPRRQRRRPQGPRHRDGLPELRALPAHVGPRQHGVRAEAAEGPQGRHREARQRRRRDPQPREAPRPQAEGALRRPAPARRAGPGDRPRAGRVPHGRAALEPRREAPRPDPRRDRPDPPAPRDDDRLRHPRPGRGDDDGHPDRRHERGPASAGRHAAGPLRPAGEPLRRRVHRQPVDELRRGHGRRHRRRRAR